MNENIAEIVYILNCREQVGLDFKMNALEPNDTSLMEETFPKLWFQRSFSFVMTIGTTNTVGDVVIVGNLGSYIPEHNCRNFIYWWAEVCESIHVEEKYMFTKHVTFL